MKKPFSIKLFLLVVIFLSWPFQIVYFFLGDSYKWMLLISMIMAGVGAFIYGNWIFKDGFKNAGWHWGKPKQYLYVLLFALFLWLFPSLIERFAGWYLPTSSVDNYKILSAFSVSFMVTIIPAFSEEFAWRGYLLPRLLKKYNCRKALIIHGLITWIWHLPFVVIMGLNAGENPWISVPEILAISLIPTTLHAVVFAFIWSRTASLAVSTMYHISFDEVRDTIENTIGLGVLGQNWQMLVLTVLGIWLLWKAKWNFRFKILNDD